jgi:predicted DNA-binding protein YlxM (UPF0122 family)
MLYRDYFKAGELIMEKHIEVSILWQIYGKLLTEKQYDVLNDYYNNDLSLSEIAENSNISRQAVRDLIKKGETKLFEYEKLLGIMEKTQQNEKTLQDALEKLSKINDYTSDKKIAKILSEVQKELSYIS